MLYLYILCVVVNMLITKPRLYNLDVCNQKLKIFPAKIEILLCLVYQRNLKKLYYVHSEVCL